MILVPVGLAYSTQQVLTGIVAAVLLTVIGAIALEWTVGVTVTILGRWHRHIGFGRTALRIAALGMIAVALLVGIELVVQQVAPGEVIGWGERPSLEPHPIFGWRLKPSHICHSI